MGLQANGLNPMPATVNYCTDAGVFSARGYDTLVFGPGNILQGHSADEYVDLAQVDQASQILEATARAFAQNQSSVISHQ